MGNYPNPLKFIDECVGFSHGQTDMELGARDAVTTKAVGYISYSIFDGEINIKMIEANPKRQGIGTQLYRKLKALHPGMKVNHGMATDEGEAWLKSQAEPGMKSQPDPHEQYLANWVRRNCRFATYSTDLGMFRDYLKGGIDPYDFPHLLPKFFADPVAQLALRGHSPEGFDEDDPSAYMERMSPGQLEAFRKWLKKNSGNLGEDDPNSPTYMHMDYGRIVPRGTWLIHFSDEAPDIKYEGFQYGHEDMTSLGLTTWYKNRKTNPGWNFAYVAGTRQSLLGSRKYGKHAVMFQSAGVEARHYGDEEDQVIFWGPGVREFVLLYNNGEDWQVTSNRDERVVYHADLASVIDWVMRNYAQYRNVIVSTPGEKVLAWVRGNCVFAMPKKMFHCTLDIRGRKYERDMPAASPQDAASKFMWAFFGGDRVKIDRAMRQGYKPTCEEVIPKTESPKPRPPEQLELFATKLAQASANF